jgi:hypothetical protein
MAERDRETEMQQAALNLHLTEDFQEAARPSWKSANPGRSGGGRSGRARARAAKFVVVVLGTAGQ